MARTVSKAERKAISVRMKRYWANRRNVEKVDEAMERNSPNHITPVDTAEDRPRRRAQVAAPTYVLHLATSHAGEMSLNSRQIGSWGQLVDVLIEMESKGADVEMVTVLKGKG